MGARVDREAAGEFFRVLLEGGPRVFLGCVVRVAERRALSGVRGEISAEEAEEWFRLAGELLAVRRRLGGG